MGSSYVCAKLYHNLTSYSQSATIPSIRKSAVACNILLTQYKNLTDKMVSQRLVCGIHTNRPTSDSLIRVNRTPTAQL